MAEVGSFNQDISKALDYLDLSKEAGVDMFKTEILHDSSVCLDDDNISVTYNTASESVAEKYGIS